MASGHFTAEGVRRGAATREIDVVSDAIAERVAEELNELRRRLDAIELRDLEAS